MLINSGLTPEKINKFRSKLVKKTNFIITTGFPRTKEQVEKENIQYIHANTQAEFAQLILE